MATTSLSKLLAERQRREFTSYLRYLVMRRDVRSAVGLADRLWRARHARRGMPSGLSLTQATDGDGSFSLQATPRLPLVARPAGVGPSGLKVPLATRDWLFSDGAPWTAHFEDPEDAFAAHRFSWLQPVLAASTESLLPALVATVVSWIDANPHRDGAPGWDSYSIAERVANWTYLHALHARRGDTRLSESTWSKIGASIGAQATILRSHLEFHGEATNNHLLNDGRGLYAAGALLDAPSLRGLGAEVIRYCVHRMFVAGFLREGSTHYHLLLCRSLLEVLALARSCGDEAFARDLAVSLTPIVGAAAFVVAPPGPVWVGDISPDVEPTFLLSVPAVGRMLLEGGPAPASEGWATLFSPGEVLAATQSPRTDTTVSSGLVRIAAHHWAAFAFLNPIGFVAAYSHGHSDMGSFTLHWRGRPILVEAGRSTYRFTPLSVYQRSIRGHNGISIDRHEPCVVNGLNGYPELVHGSYLDGVPRADVAQTSEGARLRIEHNGFARVVRGCTAVRSLELGLGEITVTDELGGEGRHTLETFFHFHPDWEVTVGPDGALARAPDGARLLLVATDHPTIDTQRGVMAPEPAGWYATKYGRTEPCATVRFTRRAKLPSIHRYALRVL